ncbi:MBL fold metallo-hydrolase [Paenibacillus sp. CMAA1739]|uniref:MBL fold metallo-hydrolase n=1 Tax=Paenibacillus ottowii TaxID=2315729 RepID=A0ABY3B6V9_9BACL|nr:MULTISPECIES: MBL fold metallo-hydrolase [Paenibacillus]KZE71211.1 metallohydrolase [Paenibacillus jamilae]MDP1510700.1 MBL fold metallo-hydrolase [Paenibacillus ottowii]MEC4566120.1 MBL fold metallo-hydrolase [Paenibacillus sp. CMAA1739]NEU26759.1 MBL fold metallo-hydrolase [Paenibacillus polymyxa]OBA02088.1 metallohydrolase [Paenibacillus polymyxa]
MGISFTVLSSGSTGNATVVRNEDTTLLIDAGLSAKRIDELLKERDLSGEELDGILVTHEHSDHVKGLGAMARKYNLPIYANEKTWSAISNAVGQIADDNRRILETGATREFESLRVESFGISHDAAEPVGYSFYDGSEKLSVATDLGYVSDKVKQAISDADVLVLEANHDVEMLRMGRYPWNIKRRILSDIGHLSNEMAGAILSELLTGRTKRTYLAHLSRDHNMMELAKMTVRGAMEDRGCFYKDSEFRLCDTYYDRPTPWDKVSEP